MWPAFAAAVAIMALAAGCGTGSGVSSTGGTSADEAAILAAVDKDQLFTEAITDTNEDEETAASQVLTTPQAAQALAATGGDAELPLLWWRGDIVQLGRQVDIHIEGGTADVTVTHDLAGTLFVVRQPADALVLWGKPFEDTVTRHARFEKSPLGWSLAAISPVEAALADTAVQTVSISGVAVYQGDALVWEADDPAALYSVPGELPAFSPGDEVRVEAAVNNKGTAGWQPAQFVFLHRPGPHINGRRTRDVMFDDGTNGDLVAGDGVYTRLYTIGPCRGRHFAAVDVMDAATFMEQDAPYNATAWGMPYIVH